MVVKGFAAGSATGYAMDYIITREERTNGHTE